MTDVLAILFLTVLGGFFLWSISAPIWEIYGPKLKAAKAAPSQEKIVRHLLGKGFVCCDTGGMYVWPLDLELKETRSMRLLLQKTDPDPKTDHASFVKCYQESGLLGLLDKHLVRFSQGQKGMFSTDDVSSSIDIWVYLDQLNSHKGFDAKLKLETWEDDDDELEDGAQAFDSGHEGFDAFFPRRVGTPRAAKLFQQAHGALDGITGFAERWKDRLDFVRVNRHVKIRLPAKELFGAEDLVGELDSLMRDALDLGKAFEAVLAPSFQATKHAWVDGPIYARVEMMASCPKCNAGMPLNAPVLKGKCSNCLTENTFDEDLWDLLATPMEDFLEGEGTVSTQFGSSGGTTLTWRVTRPVCRKCGAELLVDDVKVGTRGTVHCSACDWEIPTFPAPDWLSKVVSGVEQVYSEEMPFDAGDARAAHIDEEISKPVLMACPSCGGSLALTADSERSTTCEYCGVNVFLPDSLWLQLHPVNKTRAWWVRYAPPLPAVEGAEPAA